MCLSASPLGLGESIIYSILPLCLKKLCPSVNTFILIISPLIFLMEDQITSLKCNGIGVLCKVACETAG